MENRLLLVEDNRVDEELTRRALRRAGVDGVAVARDGQEALDFVFCRGRHEQRDPADLPALVVLDVNLPKLSGIEVVRALRAHPATRLLPTLMLISSGAERDLEGSRSAGADSCLRKPLDVKEFVAIVEQLGLQSLLRRAIATK